MTNTNSTRNTASPQTPQAASEKRGAITDAIVSGVVGGAVTPAVQAVVDKISGGKKK